MGWSSGSRGLGGSRSGWADWDGSRGEDRPVKAGTGTERGGSRGMDPTGEQWKGRAAEEGQGPHGHGSNRMGSKGADGSGADGQVEAGIGSRGGVRRGWNGSERAGADWQQWEGQERNDRDQIGLAAEERVGSGKHWSGPGGQHWEGRTVGQRNGEDGRGLNAVRHNKWRIKW
jgi:hypothetical protein